MCENCLRVNGKSVHLMEKHSFNNGNVKVFTEKCMREFLQFKWKSQTKVFKSLDFNKKIASSSSLRRSISFFLVLHNSFCSILDYATINVFLQSFVFRIFCLIQFLSIAWIEFIVITFFFFFIVIIVWTNWIEPKLLSKTPDKLYTFLLLIGWHVYDETFILWLYSCDWLFNTTHTLNLRWIQLK